MRRQGTYLKGRNRKCWNVLFENVGMLEVLGMRVKIVMACVDCKQRNYNTMKNKKNDPDRIEMKKYCKFCHKHTSHKETK